MLTHGDRFSSERVFVTRVETALERCIERVTAGSACPPKLAAAIRHAVLEGGGRVRPCLVHTVARACGDPTPDLTDAAALSLELLHCASLAHDDLPCFDNAPTRRGRPSVHQAFGEEIAVLAGDGLIVQAFAELARVAAPATLVGVIAEAAGAARGIVAGQAWESEEEIDITLYHRAKSASLFEAATAAGAIAAGADPTPWRRVGALIGEAYQLGDDLADAVGADLGKPLRQDARLGRPNCAARIGVRRTLEKLDGRIQEALSELPACGERELVASWLQWMAKRLVPPELAVLRADDAGGHPTAERLWPWTNDAERVDPTDAPDREGVLA